MRNIGIRLITIKTHHHVSFIRSQFSLVIISVPVNLAGLWTKLRLHMISMNQENNFRCFFDPLRLGRHWLWCWGWVAKEDAEVRPVAEAKSIADPKT